MKKTLAVVATGSLLIGTVVATRSTPPKCVAAPREGADCLRRAPHWNGEARWFGAGNSFARKEAVGSKCEPMPDDSCAGEEP